MNVLVTDDDGVTRILLSSALSKLGHTVEPPHEDKKAETFSELEREAAGIYLALKL